MIIFLSAVFAVALLVSIVYALHRYQQKEKTESVDRALPLPPLEVDGNHIIADENPEDILGLSGRHSSASAHSQPPPHSRSSVAVPHSVSEIAAPATRKSKSANWLSESRRLRGAGDLHGALQLCRQAYPQAGAFKQACVVIRAMVREARKMEQNPEPLLESLYRTAALSAYFHAEDDKLPSLSSSELRKIVGEGWIDMSLPYQEIGVEHIALLNNADIRQLQECWGVPDRHVAVRHFHQEAWLQMIHNVVS